MADIYGSHEKFLERFPKTQINNHGNDEHGGLIWEWDPVRHRQVAKQLSPAFSGRALKEKEPTIHKYVDLFVERMESFGNGIDGQGVSLPTWINWIVSPFPRRCGLAVWLTTSLCSAWIFPLTWRTIAKWTPLKTVSPLTQVYLRHSELT